ncbi:MAG: aldo/keto reductase [Anaerolineae bacterium]
MRFKELHDGRRIPVLGLGTAGFGAGHASFDREVRAIQAALDMGYTHLDTAEVYGSGQSEKIIGKAIEGYDRSGLFITTKVSDAHLRYDQVMKAIDGSLKRLNAGYVDLYLIHGPDPKVPLQETFDALNELVEIGKVRYIGVSNFDQAQMAESFRLTKSLLATNQVRYSLLYREPENNRVLEYCQTHDILLTAYTPIEKGRMDANTSVQAIATQYSATPAQLALAWLIHKDHVITIPKAANEEHMRENLGALDLDLASADMQTLDRLMHQPVRAR